MITNSEKEWIKRNMPLPDGTSRAFSIEEIMEALGK